MTNECLQNVIKVIQIMSIDSLSVDNNGHEISCCSVSLIDFTLFLSLGLFTSRSVFVHVSLSFLDDLFRVIDFTTVAA